MIGLDVKRVDEAATILCIGAHCDDIEIGCGGTLSKWVRERPNVRVVWAIFGGEPVRDDESREAARRIGGSQRPPEVRLHQFRSGYFPGQYCAIKDAFELLKSEIQPDVVLTHTLRDRHQDHALLGELTWNTFRSHLILEYEIPKYEGDLGQPNVFVPLAESDIDRKVAVLMDCFQSQRTRGWFTPETFRGLARLRGVECAAPGGYAEAFHARKLVL